MPLPSDKTTEIESEVPIRKPRRKRRRRRKRPRTSTHSYEENINHPVRYQEPLESDYAEGYVRRRPMKRRRRPIHRRPIIEGGGEEENILPRRKLIRRPTDFGNKTRNEDVKQWEPVTTTEDGKWKPVRTTTETTDTITTITPKSNTIATTTTATPKMTTVAAIFSTPKSIEDNLNHKDVGLIRKSNSSRADFIVLHKRPINSNLPPTSAVIRRRLKPQNITTSDETTTIKQKIIVTKEELPSSLLPPGFKMIENTPLQNNSMNNTETYQFNDEALTKIMKEQPNSKNDEFKFKSDTIPKVKDEILSLLKTKTGSSLLLNVLNLRNMSLEELLQHRERGSSQRHQELINTKEELIDLSSDEPIVSDDVKNFTNYLIETKRLAQNNKNQLKTEELNTLELFTENTKDLTNQAPKQPKNLNEDKQENKPTEQTLITQEITNEDNKSKILIEMSKEVKSDHKNITVSDTPKKIDPIINVEEHKQKEEEVGKIKLHTIFEEKKVFSFPTTTTYTTTNMNHQESEATSFVSKTPKTKIILETPEREPRLFDSMPDFSIKTTPRAPITPTIPSQVLFIQDTNHLDKYQSYEEKNKDIDEDNNLVYRRFEMRKLPVAVKSAIIASAAILAVAILGFFVLLISCRMRQKKQVLRKKSIFCQHNLHHDPDLRSSARSTSPVMDTHCQDQYYDGYGGRIDTHTTANRQYYLWRTLRKTFRYD